MFKNCEHLIRYSYYPFWLCICVDTPVFAVQVFWCIGKCCFHESIPMYRQLPTFKYSTDIRKHTQKSTMFSRQIFPPNTTQQRIRKEMYSHCLLFFGSDLFDCYYFAEKQKNNNIYWKKKKSGFFPEKHYFFSSKKRSKKSYLC